MSGKQSSESVIVEVTELILFSFPRQYGYVVVFTSIADVSAKLVCLGSS